MYYLMNKDNKIAEFDKTQDALAEGFCSLKILSENGLPAGFEDINTWIEKRQAAKHREHLKRLMAECGCLSGEGFIKFTHAASLNDSFWVKSDSENVCWRDVSLYQNEFDDVISRISFEGTGIYGIEFSTTTPEFSTEGAFEKCWKRENDIIYLYKRGSDGARNSGKEPYSEYYASQIADILCPYHVTYEMIKLHGRVASKCRLFTDEKIGFVPAASIIRKRITARELLEFYAGYGNEEEFRRMIVLDAVIFNTDRHMGNHGVIIDNDTLEIKGMAPVFDNNQSLLPYAEEEDFLSIGKYLELKSPRIGEDFIHIAKSIINSSIKSDLINIANGFEFVPYIDEKFNKERLKKLEELIRTQILGILDKRKLYTSAVFPKETSVVKKLHLNKQKINQQGNISINTRENREAEKERGFNLEK